MVRNSERIMVLKGQLRGGNVTGMADCSAVTLKLETPGGSRMGARKWHQPGSCHAMGIFLYLPRSPWLKFFCSTTQYATCRVRAGTQGALLKLWLHCGCQAAAQPRPDNGGYLHSPNSLVPLQTGMQCSLLGATIQNFGPGQISMKHE